MSDNSRDGSRDVGYLPRCLDRTLTSRSTWSLNVTLFFLASLDVVLPDVVELSVVSRAAVVVSRELSMIGSVDNRRHTFPAACWSLSAGRDVVTATLGD